jgi:hypothetical protein
MIIPTFQVKRMNHLLSNDDIRGDVSICNESRLRLTNIVGKVIFDPISQRLGYYFINNITEANRPVILWNNRLIFLRNESYKSMIDISRQMCMSVEMFYHFIDVIFCPRLVRFVKSCIKTIWSRGYITPHMFNNVMNFFEIRDRVSVPERSIEMNSFLLLM